MEVEGPSKQNSNKIYFRQAQMAFPYFNHEKEKSKTSESNQRLSGPYRDSLPLHYTGHNLYLISMVSISKTIGACASRCPAAGSPGAAPGGLAWATHWHCLAVSLAGRESPWLPVAAGQPRCSRRSLTPVTVQQTVTDSVCQCATVTVPRGGTRAWLGPLSP